MKLFSTYKAKLIGLLITCVSLACLGISIIAISAMKKNSISIFENQGISIIQKAQKHINGDYFEELIETKDESSKFFKSTHQNLLSLKKHTDCTYLYTLSTKDGKNFSYVIDASDEFYSDEVEKIGTPVDVTEDINEITKAITERTIVPTEMYFTEEWGWIISFYGPIINSQDKVIGVVACDFLVADFLSQIKKVALLIGIASVIFLVVFVIVQAIYLSYFFNKLNDVTKAMNNIATGESDLTARIQFLNDNELGQLSKACNTVMEKLQSMIHTVKESVSGLQEKSSALHSNSETTLNKIATIKEDVSDIDNQVENQNSLATTVSQNVQNLHNVIDSLTNNISEQTNAISQSSTAIEEITANIDSITKNINSMSTEYESIVKDTKEGKRLQDLVKKQVEEIEEKASDLQNANVIITNISAQTNLLAMNAAIEAAHAGKAGVGFSVVAGEIRALAINSNKQTESIGLMLSNINEAVKGIVEVSGESAQSFDRLGQRISNMENMLEQIRNGINEQNLGAQNILEMMQIIDSSARTIISESEEMAQDSDYVQSSMKELHASAESILENTHQMVDNLNEVKNCAVVASNSSEQSLDLTTTLNSLVKGYKTE